MSARRPNLTNAAIEGGFVLAALAAGLAGAPRWSIGVFVVIMIAYWAWSRRRTLTEMRAHRPSALLSSALVTLALLVLVLSGAYFLGRFLGGAFA